MRNAVGFVLFVAATVGMCTAQQRSRPDFSGRWELEVSKTEAPAQPPEMEQVVEHNDPLLKWSTTFKDAKAQEMMLPFLMGIADPKGQLRADGKEEVVKTGPFERRSITAWNGQRLVTTWTMKTPQDPPQGRWVRFLSSDGKTQTVEIEFRSAMMGTVRAKLVFSKR